MINEKQNGGGRILQLLILFCLYGMCSTPLYAKQDIASPQQTGICLRLEPSKQKRFRYG